MSSKSIFKTSKTARENAAANILLFNAYVKAFLLHNSTLSIINVSRDKRLLKISKTDGATTHPF